MLMKKSGEERFLMGISLCETARKMVLASFPDNINEDEKHVKLLIRYYKNEFSTNEMNKIVDNIKTTQFTLLNPFGIPIYRDI